MFNSASIYPPMPLGSLSLGIYSDAILKGYFIADSMAPVTNQKTRTGRIYKVLPNTDQGSSKNVSSLEPPEEVRTDRGYVTYSVEQTKKKYTIDPDEIDESPDPDQEQQNEMVIGEKAVTRQCLVWAEEKAAAAFSGASKWGSSGFVSSIWGDNLSTAKPVEDILNIAEDVDAKSDFSPNAVFMDVLSFYDFMKCANVKGILSNDQVKTMNPMLVKLVLSTGCLANLEYIFVGRAKTTSTNKSKKTDITRANVWGRGVLTFYHEPSIDPNTRYTDSAMCAVTNRNIINPLISVKNDIKSEDEMVKAVHGKLKRDYVIVDKNKGGWLDTSATS